MEYMIVTENELDDIMDVCSGRNLETYYSHEADGIHVYADADTLDEIEDIIWAADAIQETEFHQEAGVSYAISMQK